MAARQISRQVSTPPPSPPPENCTTLPKLVKKTGDKTPLDLHHLLETGSKQLELGQERDVILVLGNTGSGKTTVTQILAGNLSRLHAVRTSGGGMVIIDDDDRIGMPTTNSKTLIPELVIRKNENSSTTAFYDCPGFSDSRGAEMDIAATYFTKSVTDHAKSVKLLFLVIHSSVQLGYDRLDFVRLVNHVVKFVKNISKFEQGIGLVVTKVNRFSSSDGSYLNDETIIGGIVEFLKEFRQSLVNQRDTNGTGLIKISAEEVNDRSELENKIAFLNAILAQDENGNFQKIGFVSSPDKCGPLSESAGVKASKEKMTTLYENLEFVAKSGNDFGFTLRPESIITVMDYEEDTQVNLVNLGGKVVKKILGIEISKTTKVGNLQVKLAATKEQILLLNEVEKNLANCSVTADFIAILKNLCQKLDIFLGLNVEENLVGQESYLQFFEHVSQTSKPREYGKLSQIIGQFADESNKLAKWYEFLSSVYDQVGKYSVQIGADKLYSKLNGRISESDTNLMSLVNSTLLRVPDEIMQIFNTQVEEGHSQLRKILKFAFTPPIVSCTSSEITIVGSFIKLSDYFPHGKFVNEGDCSLPKTIVIIATHTLFVDADISEGQGFDISAISAKWEVIGTRIISLDGSSAGSHTPQKVGIFSGHGLPGMDGENGGEFYGIGKYFINPEHLTISANGGRGGDGQDGGDGARGQDSRDVSYYSDFSSCFNMNQNELDLTLLVWSKSHRTIYAGFAGSGGHAGNGGASGVAGRAGNVKLYTTNQTNQVNIISKGGEMGNPGKGGIGGVGGVRGNGLTCNIQWITVFCYYSSCSTIYDNRRSAEGHDGKEGAKLSAPPPVTTIQREMSPLHLNLFKDFASRSPCPVGDHEFETWLESDATIGNLYDTDALVEEVLAAITNAKSFETRGENDDDDFSSVYLQSLLGRIEGHATRNNDITTVQIGLHLYSALLSTLSARRDRHSSSKNVVVDTTGYFNLMSTTLTTLATSDARLALKQINRKYSAELDYKIETVMETVSKFEQEVQSIQAEVNNATNIFLGDVAHSLQAKTEISPRDNNGTISFRGILKIVSSIAVAISFLGENAAILGKIITSGDQIVEGFLSSSHNTVEMPDFLNSNGPHVVHVATNKLSLLINATESLIRNPAVAGADLSGISQIAEESRQICDKLNFDEETGSGNSVLNFLLSEQGCNRILSTWNSLSNLFGEEVQLLIKSVFKFALNNSENRPGESRPTLLSPSTEKQFELENKIYTNFIPLIQQMQHDLRNVTFSSSPHVKKYRVGHVLQNIRKEMKSIATLGGSEGQLISILDKLEQAVLLNINLYSEISYFQEQKRLGDYISKLHTVPLQKVGNISNIKLATTLSQLDRQIHLDLLLFQYRIGLAAFQQWVFPFADMYLRDLMIPPTFPTLNISDAGQLLTNRVTTLTQRLNDYKTQIVGGHDTFLLHNRFSSSLKSSRPFYTWKSERWEDSIRDFLAGEEVQLLADIGSSPGGKDAVKFTEIELNFKFSEENSKRESDFMDELKHFGVSLIHSGLSYYRYKEEVFLIWGQNVTLRYNFEKSEGRYTGRNGVVEKLRKGDFLLSPYAMWTMRLYRVNGNEGSFKNLQRFAPLIDLELEGTGTYVDDKVGGVRGDLKLREYYEKDAIERWDEIGNDK